LAAERRNAIVTGASSGIGEAAARRLARDGWRLLLVARREDRLRELASSLPDAAHVAVDLTGDDAPARVREAVEQQLGGELQLLVNNAGASQRAAFGDAEKGGWDNVRQLMELNFNAVVRLTEALLPIVRRSSPSAIVNVSSVAGRIASPRSGAYNASKFALAGWTEALHMEEKANGVHVGLVLPGFVATEGFPQSGLVDNPATRWIVSKPEVVAEAIVDAGPGGRFERTTPRGYRAITVLRALAPRLVVRVASKRS
jgi:short-subunit dehydrogenase